MTAVEELTLLRVDLLYASSTILQHYYGNELSKTGYCRGT
jgi:hypothetical protein